MRNKIWFILARNLNFDVGYCVQKVQLYLPFITQPRDYTGWGEEWLILEKAWYKKATCYDWNQMLCFKRKFNEYNLFYHILHFFRAAKAPTWWLSRLSVQAWRSQTDSQTTGSTPLNEWSAHHRDFCLTTQNKHKARIFMTSAGFEPAIPANKPLHTHALDRTATWTG